eukprot:447637_1
MTPSIYELATNNRHNNVDKQPLNINNEIEIEINENNIDSDDNELLYENDINNKREFKLFGNQVAGTLPMLHSNGKLYKPLKTESESKFYSNILQWLPEIETFIPKYSGIEEIKMIGLSNNNNGKNENNLWSTQMYAKHKNRICSMPFLILEDLTLKYLKPNILDLKIGIRHFPPICKLNKMVRKLKKSYLSTCKDFGVRIGGLQMYNNINNSYDIMDKHKAMLLKKNNFIQNICHFFNQSNKEIINIFIKKLNKILNILKNEKRFRWFSCSLLFVYEGYNKEINNSKDNEHKNKENNNIKLDLKLIDFTNFVVLQNYTQLKQKHEHEHQQHEHEHHKNDEHKNGLFEDGEMLQLNDRLDNLNEPDYGILFGLETLIKLMNELANTGIIKNRNEKEWIEYRDNITYSKMA